MARIAYADTRSPEHAATAARIVAERGSVLNLYAMLLHSGPVAEGWLAFLTAIRQKCSLSAKDRELVIMHIAVLNEAPYEFDQHVPFAMKAGMGQGQIDALAKGDIEAFLEREQDILEYARAMTRDIRVADDVFARVRLYFSEREIVELTATIAAYNMVSRFLEALQIDHD
jgi:alkylhydroperoxidase family enzyme